MTAASNDPWAKWESPRAIALIVGTTAVLFSVVGGVAGYQLGSRPPPPAPTIVFQPGAIQLSPAMPR
jgi:hypothetical protein